jgi:hypothetical protein
MYGALSFSELYDASAIATQVVVFGVASRETSVSKHYAIEINGVVAVVVVSAEYTHDISALYQSCKQTAVQIRTADFLTAGAVEGGTRSGECCVVFDERDVEKHDCGQGSTTVLCGVLLAGSGVPIYLVAVDIVVSFDVLLGELRF